MDGGARGDLGREDACVTDGVEDFVHGGAGGAYCGEPRGVCEKVRDFGAGDRLFATLARTLAT